jgi:hypothetical protein
MKLDKLHLMRGETSLGNLRVYEFDMPWVYAKFEATPEFAQVKPIFERELALIDSVEEKTRNGKLFTMKFWH